ncbi:hypothetical protein BCR33DRAFT_718487 [Rhizoclosmatium globosum]|uniref:Chloride channel protein n=1 Tax=Rhizoclosmatium globosum TaxID=329046 RepID=A0A1Y2C637_9FUNG|nr:hypothetical protein BCR33DRAFT_718487 [Rhizoclosmatium globosum]|eukprot:ORY42344.1 hypothetical protein BCR33DRAFT_718487 [Rhizoclosmatium globosum]
MPKAPDDFDTIDWVQDVLADHKRRRDLRESPPSSAVEGAFESMQSWILLLILGVSLGLTAAFIDIIAAWLVDVRLGHCESEFYLSKAICCTVPSLEVIHVLNSTTFSSDECPRWIPWSSNYFTSWIVYIFFASTFAAITATLVVKIAPNAAGGGTPEIKTILGGFSTTDFLDFKTFLIKALTLPLTVASGLAVGKEGPMIHVASSLAGVLPEFFPKYKHNEGRKREIIAIAAASGVAVAFGAPIGGTLFSLEELSSFFPSKTMLRSFFCALVACVTLQFVDPYRGKRVLFEVTFSRNWLMIEIIGFCFLEYLGLSGAFVIKISQVVGGIRKKHWITKHPILEVILMTILTGLFTHFSHRIDGSELLEHLFQECTTVMLLFIALCVRLSLTVVSLGLKVPVTAGIFIPSMLWGGLFGRLVGVGMETFQKSWPHLSVFSSSIGALGGVTRLTLALTVIMFELTGTLNYIVPCMIVLMVAKLVGDAFGKGGMTDQAIHALHYPFLEIAEDLPLGIVGRPIQDAMTPFSQLVVLKKTLLTMDEAEHIVSENTGFRGYPVVRSQRGREFMGFVNFIDGRNMAMHRMSDLMVDLTPYINRTPLSVHPKLQLEVVMEMFKKLGPRYVVILHNGRLEGLITKKDILKAVHEYEQHMDTRGDIEDYDEMGSMMGDQVSLIQRA